MKFYEIPFILGFCSINDIDMFLNHMNNARYQRELDFARVDFLIRTQIYQTIKKLKGKAIFVGAVSVRYRVPIKLFSGFKITSKILFWDTKSIFLEQHFVGRANLIHARFLSKITVIDCSVEEVMEILLKINSDLECIKLEKPEMIKEVSLIFN